MLKALGVGIIFAAAAVVAMADAPMCGDTTPRHEDLLSAEEWDLVTAGKSNGDLVLTEAAALEKAKALDSPQVVKGATRISWEQARKLILLGAVAKVIQLHDLSVQLTTRSKKVYAVQEPHIGAVIHMVKVVDPCQVLITIWSE